MWLDNEAKRKEFKSNKIFRELVEVVAQRGGV